MTKHWIGSNAFGRISKAAQERLPRRGSDRRGCAAPAMVVATETIDQLDLQALHGVRERFVSQRTIG
jgi:hypothetical protein